MRARTAISVAGVAMALTVSQTCNGFMAMGTSLQINFTDANDARTKAAWSSEPNRVSIMERGLGWDGDREGSVDGWIVTRPLAIGTSWRTATSISVAAEIQPAPLPIQTSDGQVIHPRTGNLYVRYSPDLKHWSLWEVLQRRTQPPDSAARTGRFYEGKIRVPDHQREAYYGRLLEYQMSDRPWKNDEEAAVHWILKQDPYFFEKYIPFIGYVEFLYEVAFPGGQRIKSLKADIGYGISGLTTFSIDPNEFQMRTSIPWRFKAE